MVIELEEVFIALRLILTNHAGSFTVDQDCADHFALSAPVGPATVLAWGGRTRCSSIPVAWVKIGTTYVSFHLMGLCGDSSLLECCSDKLKARMQGKSCFNFKHVDEQLFRELDELTSRSLLGMRKAGYIA